MAQITKAVVSSGAGGTGYVEIFTDSQHAAGGYYTINQVGFDNGTIQFPLDNTVYASSAGVTSITNGFRTDLNMYFGPPYNGTIFLPAGEGELKIYLNGNANNPYVVKYKRQDLMPATGKGINATINQQITGSTCSAIPTYVSFVHNPTTLASIINDYTDPDQKVVNTTTGVTYTNPQAFTLTSQPAHVGVYNVGDMVSGVTHNFELFNAEGGSVQMSMTGEACICNAPTTAPALSVTSGSNTCPSTTFNLGGVTATGTSGTLQLIWGNLASFTNANKLTNLVVGTGTYYAKIYDSVNACYSPERSFVVTVGTCNNIQATAGQYIFNATKGVQLSGNVTGPSTVPCTNNGSAIATTYGVVTQGVVANMVMNTNGTFTYTAPAGTTATTDTITYGIYCNGSTTPTATNTITLNILGICAAGNFAPLFSTNTGTNSCPATTFNLGSLVPTNAINGVSIIWGVNNTFLDAGKLTNLNVGAGAYFARFYDAANNCYSPASSISRFDVTINSCTANATAINDSIALTTSSSATINLATNDTPCSLGTTSYAVKTLPAKGVVTITSTGIATYTKNQGATGVDSFQYSILCNGVEASFATVNVTMPNAIAVNDSFSTEVGIAYQGTVVNNDTPCSSGATTYQLETAPSKGIVSINSVGQYSYTASQSGTDEFQYSIYCAGIKTSTATVTITVSPKSACTRIVTYSNCKPVLSAKVINVSTNEDATFEVTEGAVKFTVDATPRDYKLVVTSTDGVENIHILRNIKCN